MMALLSQAQGREEALRAQMVEGEGRWRERMQEVEQVREERWKSMRENRRCQLKRPDSSSAACVAYLTDMSLSCRGCLQPRVKATRKARQLSRERFNRPKQHPLRPPRLVVFLLRRCR